MWPSLVIGPSLKKTDNERSFSYISCRSPSIFANISSNNEVSVRKKKSEHDSVDNKPCYIK